MQKHGGRVKNQPKTYPRMMTNAIFNRNTHEIEKITRRAVKIQITKKIGIAKKQQQKIHNLINAKLFAITKNQHYHHHAPLRSQRYSFEKKETRKSKLGLIHEIFW
uniref:Uncharacterized protein n=1 Tax=Cacopsylla melanoneura TaxID=428564 RepID=A0A8D8W991_9HEMI